MANKIGNYIHYHKANYIKYGIGIKNKFNPQFSYNQYRNRLLKLYQNNKLFSFAKKYERTLNDIYGGIEKTDRTNSISKQRQEELEKAINDVLLNKLNNVASKVMLDQSGHFSTVVNAGGGSTISSFNYTKSMVKNHFKNRKGQIKKSTLQNYQKDIQNKIKLLRAYSDDKNLEKIIAQMGSTFNAIKKYLKSNLPSGKDQKFSIDDGSLGSILNQVIECYNYDFNLNYYLNNGLIGEVMGAFAAQFVIGSANNEVDKMIENVVKSLTGTSRSSPSLSISSNSISKKGTNGIFSEKFTLGWSNWRMNQNMTQNKSDISIDFRGTPINISYKKYSSNTVKKHGISTVNGTSLLTYLVDEDTNFINHWLNLVTVADDEKANIGASFLSNKRQEAQNIMKLIIALKSIRGAQGRTGNANIFAVNKGKNIFKVYTLYDIIQRLTIGNSLNGVEIVGLSEEYKQNWKGHWGIYSMSQSPKRISELLGKIHQEKISVHLMNTTGLFS